MSRTLPLLLLSCACAACTGTVDSPLPRGADAYALIPATTQPLDRSDYVVGPLDTLSVEVFQEPDLSVEDIQVDASGNILLPLVGTVKAQGKSAPELADEIARSLAVYLVKPRVTVTTDSITQKVAIEGEVNQPGVYEIKGDSTLLEALAMARSPTKVADLDQVIVFRTADGRRAGATFDLKRIRAGVDPDPVIVGGDRIVVGYSSVKGAFRDFLSLPVLRVFTPF